MKKATMNLSQMQKTVKRELLNYRLSKERQLSSLEALMWVRSIEAALSMFLNSSPDKARFMICRYGLDGNRPKSRFKLADEFLISEATVYRWEGEIIWAVQAAAVQLGILHPYAALEEVSV